MPSETEKQRKFMGADLQRAREGKKTRTGMSEDQLSDFASKPLAKSISERIDKIEKALAPDATPKDFDEKKAEISAREQRDRKAANHTEWAKKIDEREGVERPAGYKPKLPVQMRNSPKVEKGEIPTCKCGSKDLRHDAKAGETHCAECGRTFGDSVKKEDWSRVHASYEMVRHLPDAKHNEKVLAQLKGAAKNIDAKQEGSHFKGEDQGHSTPRGYPPMKKSISERIEKIDNKVRIVRSGGYGLGPKEDKKQITVKVGEPKEHKPRKTGPFKTTYGQAGGHQYGDK